MSIGVVGHKVIVYTGMFRANASYLESHAASYFATKASVDAALAALAAHDHIGGDGGELSPIFNNMGKATDTYDDFDEPTDFGPRFIAGTANGPGTGSTYFYTMGLGLGAGFPWSSYAIQIAFPRMSPDNYLSIRRREIGSWGAWSKISAGYADQAGALVDGTPAFVGDALAAISAVKATAAGEIDHATLPKFAQATIQTIVPAKIDPAGKIAEPAKNVDRTGRDVGKMVSVITVAVQQLEAKITELEKKIAAMPVEKI